VSGAPEIYSDAHNVSVDITGGILQDRIVSNGDHARLFWVERGMGGGSEGCCRLGWAMEGGILRRVKESSESCGGIDGNGMLHVSDSQPCSSHLLCSL
jgi:hypothetical protein